MWVILGAVGRVYCARQILIYSSLSFLTYLRAFGNVLGLFLVTHIHRTGEQVARLCKP